MSIRAYRINEIKYNKSETFNCWHDDKLWDKLMSDGYLETLNMDGGGSFELPISYIKEEILTDKNISHEIKENFKEDLKWAKKEKRDYVLYSCF